MGSQLLQRVGKRIRLLRRRRDWRQIDLAAHAEVSKNHICEIERGQRELGLLTLEKIAIALEVSPADLLR